MSYTYIKIYTLILRTIKLLISRYLMIRISLFCLGQVACNPINTAEDRQPSSPSTTEVRRKRDKNREQLRTNQKKNPSGPGAYKGADKSVTSTSAGTRVKAQVEPIDPIIKPTKNTLTQSESDTAAKAPSQLTGPEKPTKDTSMLSEQNTMVLEKTTTASLPSPDTPPVTPINDLFTVTLKNAPQRNSARVFVLVTIHPQKQGMHLRDLFVTATLSLTGGTTMGSSRKKKQGSFVYDQPLIDCNVGKLLLYKVNSLGTDDTDFPKGKEAIFKIEIKKYHGTREEAPYTLTLHLTHKQNNADAITASITLAKPKP